MKEISVNLLAQLVQGQVEGNPEVMITGVGKIDAAQPGDLVFLSNPKYENYLYETKASVALVSNDFKATQAVSCTLVRVADPYSAFAILLREYEKWQRQIDWSVHPSSIIDPSVQIPEKISIGAFTYIGPGAQLAKGCIIESHVTLGPNVVLGENCHIHAGARLLKGTKVGNRCVIQANSVIGSDGFGFAPQPDGSYMPIPQLGNVELEDDVHIGANCTIDRATTGTTRIKKGTKLDNLIQVAHNVEIGSHTVVAAQTGIAGSTKIGNFNKIGGQVGIAGHIHLADGTQIAAQSGIMKTIKQPYKAWFGSPAFDLSDYLKASAVFRKLPQLWKDVEDLKKQEPKN